MATEIFEQHGASRDLVVIFHALNGSPQAMVDVVAAVKAYCPDADVLVPPLPFGGRLGQLAFRPPARIAAEMAVRIDRAVAARAGGYMRILFIGYSFGAMIARKVAVIAHGERHDAPFEADIAPYCTGYPWAGAIERIVLLAGFSRGWSAATSRDWLMSAKWTIGAWIGEIIRTLSFAKLELSALQIRQGSSFVVQTRLQWLALVSPPTDGAAAKALPAASPAKIEAVQLLGAVDDLVAPDDSVDWAIDTVTDSFALVEVPGATHGNVTTMKRPTQEEEKALVAAACGESDRSLADLAKWGHQPDEKADPAEGVLMAQVRWILLGWALTKALNDPQFAKVRITREEMADTPAMRPDATTTDVVFVIHGIRDRGFWTQKIARVIKREARRANDALPSEREGEKRRIQSFTGSYGYFAMVPFILPWVRRWKTDWLMDRYTEARAIYPEAKFSYVGHSNGTYLLAKALQDYPAAHFDRVVFAGSVVRRDYDWRQFLEPQHPKVQPRVNEVLNYVATRDWVVALLPKGFQPLKFFFDVGSAGHDGFNQGRASSALPPPRGLYEARCVKGSHSAGISETQWDDIANFIINGKRPPKNKDDQDFQAERSPVMVLGGWVSSAFVLLLLWLVIGTGVALFRSINGSGVVELAGVGRALWAMPGAILDMFLGAPRWIADTVGRIPEIAVAALSAICGAIGAFFRGVGAALFQGRIATFSDAPPVGESGLRAAVFAAYCWVVYLFVTRF